MASLLIQGLQDIMSTRYAELGSSTIIIFEHLITLDDEINLIWTAPFGGGKLLFFVNRYYSLFSVLLNNYALFSSKITDRFCLSFFHWQGFSGVFPPMIAHIILLTRVYALYLMDKRILFFMLTCFAMSTTASSLIMGFVMVKIQATSAVPLTDFKFCSLVNVPRTFYTFWIPDLIFESILCFLVLYKAWQNSSMSSRSFLSLGDSQNSRTHFQMGNIERKTGSVFLGTGRGEGLVNLLISDSVFYYVVIFASYLTNFLVFLLARSTLLEVPIGYAIAMSCVLGNRLMLNIRRVNQLNRESEQHRNGSMSQRDTTIQFRHPDPRTLSDIEMDHLRSLKAEK